MELAPTPSVLEFEHSDFSDDEDDATSSSVVSDASIVVGRHKCITGPRAGPTSGSKGGDDRLFATPPPASRSDAAPPTRCRSWLASCCGCRRHANTVISVFLLVFNVLVLSTYFAMHCTSVLDKVAKHPGTRAFIGVTPSIEIISGILLGLGLGMSLFVLAKVRWRFTWTHTRVGACDCMCLLGTAAAV